MKIAKKLLSDLKEEKIFLKLNEDDIEIVSYGKSLDNEMIEEIKSNKESLIRYLKSMKGDSTLSIPVADKSDSYPLSSAQRRLWIASRFEEGSTAFNISYQLKLTGKYEIESFKKAIDSVIERHEILRTVFREDEKGEARQWILLPEDLGFEINFQDLRGQTDNLGVIQNLIEEDSNKPFDLENGPLLRANFFWVSQGHYLFYYSMHHIISDLWSREVLAKEVLLYYKAHKTGNEPNLPKLPIQYKDYSVWELGQFENDEYKQHKNYWITQLSGEIPILDLPSRKIRPSIKTYNGFSLQTYLSSETTLRLKTFVKEQGGTLFMGVLAGLNILLSRYTSERDIVIGTGVSGRNQFDLSDQIGFYMNVLALRNEIVIKENFKSFFDRLRENTMNAFKHQAYPFDRLDLEFKYDTSRNPVFDISVTFDNISDANYIVDANKIDVISTLGRSVVKNDIEFHFQEVGESIKVLVNFNTDVYEQEMVQGLLENYKQLLSSLLVHQEKQIGLVDYLPTTQKKKLLIKFNDNHIDFLENKTVLSLFAEQVIKTPNAVALVAEEKKLSYKTLDEISNQLANYIINTYEIKPNDLIGIELNRTEWMIISILGILKSGAAYVPIDPQSPSSRKAHIAQDANLKLLITDSSNLFEAEYFNGELFALDIEFDPTKCSSSPLQLPNQNSLAYVIYTSGTTGIPKGVMVEHRSLVSSILSRNEFYENLNSVLPFPSFSFDASVGHLWNSLTTGSTYHVASDEMIKNPEKVLEAIKKFKIESIALSSSYYKLLLETTNFDHITLKRVISGGELIQNALVEKHFKLNKNCAFYNEYGPTENTIWTTVTKIAKKFKRNLIGKPVANNEVFILDDQLQLIPVGVVGEIYIGGDNLSKGYLNQSELTMKMFIDNPFDDGKRIYRTGDYGRWWEDGSIEFLGRKDNQVKVRGFRVELTEVEYQIQTKKDIDEVVVIAEKNLLGEVELVAYFVSKNEQKILDLNFFLLNKLPEYMIPHCYVQLEKFPLTINGKIDREYLQKENGLVLSNDIVYVEPSNEKERTLILILEEILNRDQIGMNDNFFSMGGDSLKLIDFISRLKKKGYGINIAEIIRNPILKDFAMLLEDVEQNENITME